MADENATPEVPEWDQVKDTMTRQFPALDPAMMQRDYEQDRKIGMARRAAMARPEGWGEYFAKRSIPYGSVAAEVGGIIGYHTAKQRLESGQPKDEDYQTIAEHEAEQQRNANRSILGKIGSGIAQIPAIVGEAGAGRLALQGVKAGVKLAAPRVAEYLAPSAAKVLMPSIARSFAQTAGPAVATEAAARGLGTRIAQGASQLALHTITVPSVYAQHWAQKNMQEGREPLDPRGLPTALGMGMAQLGVLDWVGKAGANIAGGGIGPWTQRLAAGTASGLVGQEMTDYLGAMADTVLPKGYETETGGGIVGRLLSGKYGEAGERLLVNAATFTVFSALHAHHEDPEAATQQGARQAKVMDDLATYMEQSGKTGTSEAGSTRKAAKVFDAMMGLLHDNPNASLADAQKAAMQFKGRERAMAMKVARAFPRTKVPTGPFGETSGIRSPAPEVPEPPGQPPPEQEPPTAVPEQPPGNAFGRGFLEQGRQYPPQGPEPGIDQPPDQGTPPAAPETSQKPQEATPTPAPTNPATGASKPTPGAPGEESAQSQEEDAMAKIIAGHPSLTPQERHVLQERNKGRVLEDIGQDEALPKKKGFVKVSKQRVKDIEKAALAKIKDAEGNQADKDFTMARFHKIQKQEGALELSEKAKLVTPKDLGATDENHETFRNKEAEHGQVQKDGEALMQWAQNILETRKMTDEETERFLRHTETIDQGNPLSQKDRAELSGSPTAAGGDVPAPKTEAAPGTAAPARLIDKLKLGNMIDKDSLNGALVDARFRGKDESQAVSQYAQGMIKHLEFRRRANLAEARRNPGFKQAKKEIDKQVDDAIAQHEDLIKQVISLTALTGSKGHEADAAINDVMSQAGLGGTPGVETLGKPGATGKTPPKARDERQVGEAPSEDAQAARDQADYEAAKRKYPSTPGNPGIDAPGSVWWTTAAGMRMRAREEAAKPTKEEIAARSKENGEGPGVVLSKRTPRLQRQGQEVLNLPEIPRDIYLITDHGINQRFQGPGWYQWPDGSWKLLAEKGKQALVVIYPKGKKFVGQFYTSEELGGNNAPLISTEGKPFAGGSAAEAIDKAERIIENDTFSSASQEVRQSGLGGTPAVESLGKPGGKGYREPPRARDESQLESIPVEQEARKSGLNSALKELLQRLFSKDRGKVKEVLQDLKSKMRSREPGEKILYPKEQEQAAEAESLLKQDLAHPVYPRAEDEQPFHKPGWYQSPLGSWNFYQTKRQQDIVRPLARVLHHKPNEWAGSIYPSADESLEGLRSHQTYHAETLADLAREMDEAIAQQSRNVNPPGENWYKPYEPFFGGQSGAVPIPVDKIRDYLRGVWDKMTDAAKRFNSEVRRIGGAMFPEMKKVDEELVNAAAHYAVTKNKGPEGWVAQKARALVDQVAGEGVSRDQLKLWGTTLTEERNRTAIKRLRTEAAAASAAGNDARARKLTERADAIVTWVGHAGSPLTDEATYQRAVNSPEYRDVAQRHEKDFTPTVERMFREAEGMDPADPIETLTQIPGRPFTAARLREEGTGDREARPKGDLSGARLSKLKSALQAGLDDHNIDTNLDSILRNTFQGRAELAAKAKLYRLLESKGGAEWGKLKSYHPGLWEIPGVDPPKGTQEAGRKEDSLFVPKEIYHEVRQLLGFDQPAPTLPGTGWLNWAALTSGLEAIYHSRNLIGTATKIPLRDLPKLWDNIAKVWKGDPAAKARLLDLAAIHATKVGEAKGMLWDGPTDPTLWVSKALHSIDQVMRLTMDDVFTESVKRGEWKDLESSRRDWINQLGQYDKLAQSRLTVLARELGIGPFATASGQFYVSGLRALTGTMGPEAMSQAMANKVRIAYLARMTGVLAFAGVVNFMLHKDIFGDEGTPFGAIKVGEKEGRTQYWDVSNILGPTRGMRETGILAALEGARSGKTLGMTGTKAFDDASRALLAPFAGPPIQFGYTAMTGKNAAGQQIAAKGTGNKAWADLQAALWQANPAVGKLTGKTEPNKDKTLAERALELTGPFGIRERAPVVGDYYARLRDLEEQRSNSQEVKKGLLFPQEALYRRLKAFEQPLNQLAAAMQGRKYGAKVEGQKPPPQELERLRKIQVDLARRALAEPGK